MPSPSRFFDHLRAGYSAEALHPLPLTLALALVPSRIYTRTGDDGTTGLFGGGRVDKTHPRIRAYGTVDEANASIGVARSLVHAAGLVGDDARRLDDLLGKLQDDLFVLGGDLAAPESTRYPIPRIAPEHVIVLERAIDDLDDQIEPLRHFILPGGAPAAAALHVARTVARRAEREIVDLAASEEVSEPAVHYVNRLSDLLFTLARWVNARAGVPDVPWAPVQRGPKAGE